MARLLECWMVFVFLAMLLFGRSPRWTDDSGRCWMVFVYMLP